MLLLYYYYYVYDRYINIYDYAIVSDNVNENSNVYTYARERQTHRLG